ncbi:hypothetical protein SAMN04487825_10980 [Prevotella sp. kh1p2]|nr:hypothetical protein SAMN04487825_10980 [Prevotella sp. kh1p2]
MLVNNEIYSYLCNVFFIVLDLRLTRLEYGGTPFLMPVSQRPRAPELEFASLQSGFLRLCSKSLCRREFCRGRTGAMVQAS